MKWILIIVLIGLAWGIIYKGGKLKFWKFINRNPDEAYKYFKEHPEAWMIVDSQQTKDIVNHLRNKSSNSKKEWEGPYRLYVPSVGMIVHIYGKRNLYEQEQDKLIAELEKLGKN